MIKLAASILVRALVELGLVLFVFAAVFFLVAYRTARRFATTAPDSLERLAGPLSAALGLVAARNRTRDEPDETGDDYEPAGAYRIASDEWEGYVI